MSASATVRVLPAEEIAARAGGRTEPLRWPERSTFFAERAMRLRQLASGHPMGDFLQFVSLLAQAQHSALARLGREGGITIPDAAAIDRASLAGAPPLAAADGPSDVAWRRVLREIVQAMRASAPGGTAAETLQRLAAADDIALDRQADALLNGLTTGLDLAAAPVVAAALQVLWTHQVGELVAAHARRGTQATQAARVVGLLDDPGLCPCCGSRPVASITRAAGDVAGQRYLHCSLCGTEWHVPRGRCTNCGASGAEKIAYQSLDRADAPAGEGDSGRPAQSDQGGPRVEGGDEGSTRAARAAVQAETCEDCGHYLKIIHGDRDPLAEPVADDLASIMLDLLVSETGKQRHGVNLMLLFGEPEPPLALPP